MLFIVIWWLFKQVRDGFGQSKVKTLRLHILWSFINLQVIFYLFYLRHQFLTFNNIPTIYFWKYLSTNRKQPVLLLINFLIYEFASEISTHYIKYCLIINTISWCYQGDFTLIAQVNRLIWMRYSLTRSNKLAHLEK